MPVRVSCPGSVLRLVSLGGGLARSLPLFAWLWVARPLVGGPVRPGRPGAWGVLLGGAVRWPSPLGGVAGSGSVRGPRGSGTGGRSASVRPSASLVRPPRWASLALLSPWRVWSPYCSGSGPCASVRARSEGGTVGRPCVPAGGWRAGWQASWRRGLPRSLWERAGDGPGARGALTPRRSAPGAAAFSGGGGGSPGLAGGYRADVPQPATGIPRAGGWGVGPR